MLQFDELENLGFQVQ